MSVCEFRPGLEGIPAAQQSDISFVGAAGLLEYRGIRIEELAQKYLSRNLISFLIWENCRQNNLKRLTPSSLPSIKYRIRDMMKCFLKRTPHGCAASLSHRCFRLIYILDDLDNPVLY